MAKWSTAYINDLPDSAFLYVIPGGEKDSEGKTTPRDNRMFPYKDAEGSVDLPHLRNALARIPQSNRVSAATKVRLMRRARRALASQQGQKGAAVPLDYKSTSLADADVKTPLGQVEAYIARFGNQDGKDDVLYPGATKETIERKLVEPAHPQIGVFYGHDRMKVCGHPLKVGEDDSGVVALTQYNLNTFWGNEVFHLIAAGDVPLNSIAFLPGEADGSFKYDDDGFRHLYQIDLYHYGPEPTAANPLAYTLDVKSALEHDGPFSQLVEQAINVITDISLEAEALVERRAERRSGWRGLQTKHLERLEEFYSVADQEMANIRALIDQHAQAGAAGADEPGDEPGGDDAGESETKTAEALKLALELTRHRLETSGVLEVS